RSPDQPLDLVSTTADLALRGLALGTLRGRAGQHLVGAGDPTRPLATEVRGDAVLDRRGTQHLRIAEADHARPLGPLLDPERDLDRPQVGGGAAIRAYMADRRPVPDAHVLASPRSAALAASQSASNCSNDRSRNATFRAAADCSTCRNRPRNFSLAARSAPSTSIPVLRPTLTRTNSRSPSSAVRWAASSASTSSPTSSRTLS